MKKHRILAVMLALVIISIACPTSNAAQIGSGLIEIQPFWVNTNYIVTQLTFSGTTADCYVKIAGYTNTTKIVATVKLEQKVGSSYTTIKTWPTKTVEGDTLTFSETHTIEKGYTYRLSVEGTVTRNGTAEPVSNSVENKP